MADTTTSFAGPTGHSIPSPEYLASYLLIFLMGLTLASSSIVRTQLSNMMGKSSKEMQPIQNLSISEVKDGSEPELLNKYLFIPQRPTYIFPNTKPTDTRS